jgi:hypothetical protein
MNASCLNRKSERIPCPDSIGTAGHLQSGGDLKEEYICFAQVVDNPHPASYSRLLQVKRD